MDEKEFNRALDDKRPVMEYIVHDAREALEEQPPEEWIIENLITAGSVSVFYGAPGSKKTWSLLSMAIHVAIGKDWLGFKTQPVKVLVIDEESGEARFKRRLNKALNGALTGEDIQLKFVCLAGFRLDDKYYAEELESLIENSGARLVIIDALCDIMTGDENSKQYTQPVFIALRKIADKTNTALLIIHHANRNGGYRGSSAIPGSVDLMVQIASENKSKWVYFTSEKERDIEQVKFSGLCYWTEDQFYMELPGDDTPMERSLNKAQRYVIRYLTENGESELQSIMNAADSTTTNGAKLAVYSLADLGIVRRTNPNEAGRGIQAKYELVKNVEINQ